jgi:hemolysin activation/secretion protein
MGKNGLTRIIIGVTGMLVTLGAFAGPIELPDSARPGAVRPGQEDKLDLPEPPPPEEVVEVPATPSDVVDVPAVIDRPFDVDECPCVVVNKFRLLNAEDMPDFEVSLAEIQQLLDTQIEDQPESGYSIGQLQEVANVIRNYYRERGLILAQVVLPVQTIEGGIVDLELYIGTLGRVLAEGNEIYSREVLENAFAGLIGQPIHKADIEAALLRLTDYPGLTVFGVFQPGQLIGTADIVLKVQEEKRFDVAMRVDNHGTQETGRNRFRTVIDWNNLTDGADRLTLTIQQTYTPKNNVFKSFAYERFLGDSYKGSFSFDTNKFDVGGEFADADIHGESETYKLGLEKSFIRSRLQNLLGRVDLYRKESTTTTAGDPTNRDRLSTLVFGIDYDSVDTFSFREEGGGINFATIEFIRGFNDIFGAMGSNADAQQLEGTGREPSRQGDSGRFAAGQFAKIFASFTRLQTLIPGQNLLFRFEWQWSDDLLVPLEQYAMGGPENVRAYPPAQVLWDRAFFYSFEWLINAPFIADQPAFDNRKWGELLQLGIFYDFAVGRLNDPLDGTEQQGYDRYDGAGVGLRFNLPGTIDSRIFMSWSIGDEEIGNDKKPQVWGDFTYSF